MKAIKSISIKKNLAPLILGIAIIILFASIVLFFREDREQHQYDVLSVCESIPEPFFSVPEGIYDKVFELEINAQPDYDIYYTTNGSTPTTNSQMYKKPILVNPNKNLNKDILYISTSPKWKPPYGRQNHCSVIRARCFKKGVGYGPVKNVVYCTPDIEKHSGFHIVHLLVENDSLFSPARGIYVMGQRYYNKKAIKYFPQRRETPNSWRRYPANYRERGWRWTRHGAQFILMNPTGETVFEQNVSYRMSGNTSQAYPHKPLRILPDNKSDTIIRYHFFDELTYPSYKILVRNAGGDAQFALLRDAMMNEMVKGTGIDTRAYVPSVVYINGNYWGIHNIRERSDQYYLSAKYDIPLQNISRISYRRLNSQNFDLKKIARFRWGPDSAHVSFVNLFNFIQQNSMADHEAYIYVTTQIEIDNFIDYIIFQTFFVNSGWGRSNVKFYRFEKQIETMKENGIDALKWRWLFCDFDFAMEAPKTFGYNMFKILQNNYPEDITTQMIFRLMENMEFKEKFISRCEYLMRNNLSTESMLEHINQFEARYQSEIKRHIARWRMPIDYQFWQQEIEYLKVFAHKRQDIYLQQIKSL